MAFLHVAVVLAVFYISYLIYLFTRMPLKYVIAFNVGVCCVAAISFYDKINIDVGSTYCKVQENPWEVEETCVKVLDVKGSYVKYSYYSDDGFLSENFFVGDRSWFRWSYDKKE